MANYKEILRLHSLGINNTRIAESCGCVHTAAASGRWCGAERPRCGLSNSRH